MRAKARRWEFNVIDLSKMATESRNPKTMHLDEMDSLEIVTVMNEEDENVVCAVKAMLPQIAKAVKQCAKALEQGGRVIYMGAGTSGRLGLLDAVECPPTFGVESSLVIGLIAGGEMAFVKAVEGAEDNVKLGMHDLKKLNLSSKDIVIGLAASGRTPYVIGGLDYANCLQCNTIAIVCNNDSEIAKRAKLAIELIVGPEVLTGSTRLKAGTAEKMVCNMISTGAMVGIGKVYENLMVDVQQTNKKLVSRTENIVMEATKCSREIARENLVMCDGNAKTAIVKILSECDVAEAKKCLEKAHGHVRNAL